MWRRQVGDLARKETGDRLASVIKASDEVPAVGYERPTGVPQRVLKHTTVVIDSPIHDGVIHRVDLRQLPMVLELGNGRHVQDAQAHGHAQPGQRAG